MRSNYITLLCLGTLLGLAATAVAQEDGSDEFDLQEEFTVLAEDTGPIESGFVFIDGEFVPGPYHVTMSEDQQEVLVNDRIVPGVIPPPVPRTRGDGARGDGARGDGARGDGGRRQFRDARMRRGGSGGNTAPPPSLWARRVRQQLDANATIVAFSGQRMRVLNDSQMYALLQSLLELDTQSEYFVEALQVPATPAAKETWKQWLLEFKPNEAYRQQAGPFLAGQATAQAQNLAQATAVRRFNAVAYPLTMLGMLLSVIAFGHLLMSLPNNDAMRRGASDGAAGISREVIRATMISVVLVAVLSSLDLIWTLLASQAGQMLELNPIASHFIHDPLSLIAFKASATLLGCGLLYALRRHSRAQLASWWMCLVCTMLTFRWLVFNSMFVT